ncbi:CopG family transcriptional regulator [Zooshikella ganghwensis]|uniref:CopG family transcriptional regulator n=1 Tax=Zooshikella ganghwensis TaxID=202772 RepID=A0A4P9VH49_9GAMM|nr:CopG family transcriptional regulator [Zooshikella ganghwensis]RDH41719.1 CopG family transcriptional regulator [Zooshikella ganghwensis]
MRTLVDIPDNQIDDLAKICEAEDISRAELIRQAIADFVEKKKRVEVNAFGLWAKADKPVDGLTYQEQIRDEW